ncbi:hypothetical protein Pan97_38990 [Bremerella volcania]|uniref:Uncharacterized protein n=1 Tax=Bremerella volcania TaxID=2527984 RepID=A0A518CC93_9BACT|nr:hypothetical protein [Bremerella volcania]QDU76842.1 hypothetical protein Pan97_38990 [Bremerella volcania]
MALSKKDKDFRLTKTSYLEFKQIEMDRVLTTLLARIRHSGLPSRIRRTVDVTLKDFTNEFLEHPELFGGFDKYPKVLEQWLETHLMDIVNRGKSNQAIAAPRPLHGFTYRFRNAKKCRDYGAAQHIYETLYHARHNGQNAIDQLKRFFFPGQDLNTDKFDANTQIDVETQALLALCNQVTQDIADNTKERDSQKPVCVGSADLMADDVIRLLVYQNFIPRSVMVEYLKILLSFHMALYHLRLFKLLPLLIKRRSADPTCATGNCPMQPRILTEPHGGCPYRVHLLADVANVPGSHMATLAERSADVHFGRITGFVKANYTIKKLDEFAEHLVKKGKLIRPDNGFAIGDLLQLLEPTHKNEREAFFSSRLAGVLETSSGASKEDIAPEIEAVVDMGLSDFETYIEIIVGLQAAGHRRNIVTALDSLMMKNDQGALLAQPRVRNSKRRVVLDGRLLEVLLQIAVLRPGGRRGFHTTEMRIEEVLLFLRERYGIYVDRLPPNDGFGEASITDREALRENLALFKTRRREVGFYRDLSDAYVTQTVTPRYSIPEYDTSSVAEEDGA